MHIGEVIRLDREDVDLTDGLLVVCISKFGNLSNSPMHDSTILM